MARCLMILKLISVNVKFECVDKGFSIKMRNIEVVIRPEDITMVEF